MDIKNINTWSHIFTSLLDQVDGLDDPGDGEDPAGICGTALNTLEHLLPGSKKFIIPAVVGAFLATTVVETFYKKEGSRSSRSFLEDPDKAIEDIERMLNTPRPEKADLDIERLYTQLTGERIDLTPGPNRSKARQINDAILSLTRDYINDKDGKFSLDSIAERAWIQKIRQSLIQILFRK